MMLNFYKDSLRLNMDYIIHDSWKALAPKNNSVWFDPMKFNNYLKKLPSSLSHIPAEVLWQWLCPFNDNNNSIKNYAWINYFNARFGLRSLPVEFFIDEVSPNSKGKELVSLRSALTSYDSFHCIEKDKQYWKERDTWRIPPVIIDVASFKNYSRVPEYVDYPAVYVLVEGHNRLGYLRAAARIGDINFQHIHSAYILMAS